MVNEECSITFSLYSFSWSHYIFNLDSFICMQSTEAYPVYIFLHVEALIICGGFHAFFHAFGVLDFAHAGLLWVLHLWARLEWKHLSSYMVIHSSCSSDFVLLKSRPLILWTIQHLGWIVKAISLLFSLILRGIWILSTLPQKVLYRCS